MKISLGIGQWNMQTVADVTGGVPVGDGTRVFSEISTDSRECGSETMFAAFCGERVDGNALIPELTGTPCFLCNRVPASFDIKQRTAVIVKDTETALMALAEAYRARFLTSVTRIGVTGSVGKTTAKEMIASVLSAKYPTFRSDKNFNSTIGLPMSLLSVKPDEAYAVLEMGMSGRGEISAMSRAAAPQIGVITNVGSAHMEKLGSREEIRNAKYEIVDGMEKGSTLLLCGDDGFLCEQAGTYAHLRVFTFGLRADNTYRAENVTFGEESCYFDFVSEKSRISGLEVSGIGNHIVSTAVCAAAIGDLCGLSAEEIRRGLASYGTVGMRQRMLCGGGFTVLADCYNASPESMKSAAEVLTRLADAKKIPAVAVLGDMLELGDGAPQFHRDVGALMAGAGVVGLVCLGSFAEAYADGARSAGLTSEKTVTAADASDAVKKIYELLPHGGAVLVKGSRAMHMEDVVDGLPVSSVGGECRQS